MADGHTTDISIELARLSSAQRAAWQHADDTAARHQAAARDRLRDIVRRHACTEVALDEAMRSIRTHARVVVHFHPDRFGEGPHTVAEGLLRDGLYRNQFETGLSSGGRTAFPGGDRDNWERSLFAGAYHTPDVTPPDRPKYGALEVVRYPDGPSARFGSCYLVLRPAVAERTSFTFAGSEQAAAAERLGTIDRMDCVVAALLAEVAQGGGASVPWPPFAAPTLGVDNLTVPAFLEICRGLSSPRQARIAGPAGRTLDSFLEAQVHGSIDLRHDVESIVVDPAFEGTPTGRILAELCRRHAIEFALHCGFRLPAREVPADFRGTVMPPLARRIAGDGFVDVAAIGAAEASLHARPDLWLDVGSPAEVLQYLKQLWHVLVQYGEPVP